MKIIKINKLPIGFFSDVHCHTNKVDKLFLKHPEITEWFFLGDLFDFQFPKDNLSTAQWLEMNIDKCHWLVGNHCLTVINQLLNIGFHHKNLVITNFHRQIKLILPDNTSLFLSHTTPHDIWNFIEKTYTEREFIDDFSIDDSTRAVVIGHNHSVFSLEFPNVSAQIWSIGALKFNEYAVFDGKKIFYKKL